jgi:lysophospholipase L1-like esterase
MTCRPWNRHLLRAATAVAVALAVLSVSGAAGACPPAGFAPPKRYYLALGDSLTYGFSTAKARAGLPPSAFNTGYVDDFTAQLAAIRPGITTVNYGCPGESTASFLTSTCIWRDSGHALHHDYPGAQIDAAVAFLRTHRGTVSPITLTLWGNDVRLFLTSCGGDADCVRRGAPAAIAQLSTNLASILGRLRAAAPDTEIIVTGAYSPYLGLLAVADPLIQALNGAMATVVTDARARFADPFPTFNPQGDPATETAALCTLTLLCTEGDSHPSDLGYRTIADEVFAASGYVRLRGSHAVSADNA